MNIQQLMRELHQPGDSKLVLLVADGLGGLPEESGGKTELESASTPNLDSCVGGGAIWKRLQELAVRGAEIFAAPARQRRFVVVFRGDNSGDQFNDTDPQQLGPRPLQAAGTGTASQNTAKAVNQFIAEAAKVLK